MADHAKRVLKAGINNLAQVKSKLKDDDGDLPPLENPQMEISQML